MTKLSSDPVQNIIQALQLDPHPKEQGYFRRTYASEPMLGQGDASRHAMTSIYYLLTANQPVSYLHRNRSDILHYYHMGAPVHYVTFCEQDGLKYHVMGHDITNGQQLQLLVKGGVWKASWIEGGKYGLISEAVVPGFDFRDNELACIAYFSKYHPVVFDGLERFFPGS
tara:strand:- start:1880 stop:2386 length:507 start_codon:yes stop_codon:yes gene_type:complete